MLLQTHWRDACRSPPAALRACLPVAGPTQLQTGVPAPLRSRRHPTVPPPTLALQLYAEMRQLGVQETVVCMTLLLKAVGSSPGPGMAQECLRIFRRMCRGPAR